MFSLLWNFIINTLYLMKASLASWNIVRLKNIRCCISSAVVCGLFINNKVRWADHRLQKRSHQFSHAWRYSRSRVVFSTFSFDKDYGHRQNQNQNQKRIMDYRLFTNWLNSSPPPSEEWGHWPLENIRRVNWELGPSSPFYGNLITSLDYELSPTKKRIK